MHYPYFLMLVGQPGVGKDTWLKQCNGVWLNAPFVECSSDYFIESYAVDMGKTYNEVFTEFAEDAAAMCHEKFMDAIYSNKNIVLNRTNLDIKTRKRWMC